MLRNIYNYFGFNGNILFTIGNSLISVIGSVVTSFFIVYYFSINEQGYYYTFGSLVALQVFFELGLGGVIVQFVAHEFSYLRFNEIGELEGEIIYKSRLASLFRFCLKWYFFLSALLFVALLLLGLVFFNEYNNGIGMAEVSWLIPWIFLVLGAVFNLFLSPILAFLQGFGKIKETAKLQALAQLSRLFIIWIGINLGTKLIILGLSSIFSAFFLGVLLFLNFKSEFKAIFKITITEKISYVIEILPYQWRIALSWISGYFVSQIFNPILFATEGSAVAGQMGLTLSALNGIGSISMSWLTTKIPTFSSLVAHKRYNELDLIFNKALKQSTFLNIILVSFFLVSIYFIRLSGVTLNSLTISSRFLAFWPLIMISATIIINHVVAGWAIYLRCHKKEPFLYFSLITGVCCLISTLYLGNNYGVLGLSAGYLTVVLVMLPWGYNIFRNKKFEWHT